MVELYVSIATEKPLLMEIDLIYCLKNKNKWITRKFRKRN